MKKANSLVLLLGIVSFGMSVVMPSRALAICTGTYYATEFADGRSNPPTGISLWTFAEDGSVVFGSSNEPAGPFGTSQGNWRPAQNANKIKSKAFNFSGPGTTYPQVARVEATFAFKNNCSGTVGGQSKFSVTLCLVSDGPLCSPGTRIVTDALIELTRVSSN